MDFILLNTTKHEIRWDMKQVLVNEHTVAQRRSPLVWGADVNNVSAHVLMWTESNATHLYFYEIYWCQNLSNIYKYLNMCEQIKWAGYYFGYYFDH